MKNRIKDRNFYPLSARSDSNSGLCLLRLFWSNAGANKIALFSKLLFTLACFDIYHQLINNIIN